MNEHGGGNGSLTAHAVLAKFSWALCSEAGPYRDHNEDFAGAYVSPEPDDAWDRPPLFALADGMGGHAAGEVASRIAVEQAVETWTAGEPLWGASGVRAAVRSANLAVIDSADAPERRGMGTTLTLLSLAGREATIGHVGDSRAYLVRDGSCTQLTSDHSRAGDMLRMKLISSEQAAVHPARSQLTRSLGLDPLVQVDVHREQVRVGDAFVICSDGLWDVVGRDDIARIVRGDAAARSCCRGAGLGRRDPARAHRDRA